MRPAIEVGLQVLGWGRAGNPKRAAAVIEAYAAEREAAAHAKAVAEIVAELRDQSDEKQDREWMGPLDIADYIEAKFGGRDG